MIRCRYLLLAVSCSVASGCGGKDRSPEGAVELFLRAAQEGDAAEVYTLLAPSSQKELEEKARLAHAQAAGRQIKPEHLLAVRPEFGHVDVTRIRRLSVDGDLARVEIFDARRGIRETLELKRVNRHWRVRLPDARPPASATVPSPPPRPASAPTSQPAASGQTGSKGTGALEPPG